ncbi:hypothetical protein HPB49_023418 [Dermacentor silvarum]|uniref:Uncharacterized protein n=1 Tax=Dermacentor silvarum TaxID=543639 RepID=A0ACB8E432_DERSI|nr:hypothetical protein HPB49_023418 [Dermacentor silvarum]
MPPPLVAAVALLSAQRCVLTGPRRHARACLPVVAASAILRSASSELDFYRFPFLSCKFPSVVQSLIYKCVHFSDYLVFPVFFFTSGLWCEIEEGGANSLLRTWLRVWICVVEEAWSACVLVRSAKGSRTLQSLESSSTSCG